MEKVEKKVGESYCTKRNGKTEEERSAEGDEKQKQENIQQGNYKDNAKERELRQ